MLSETGLISFPLKVTSQNFLLIGQEMCGKLVRTLVFRVETYGYVGYRDQQDGIIWTRERVAEEG
jgi:hypothetical protein